MPKLIVMLRVKDGIFFADEWLQSYEKIADEIVVLDNGSTDGTLEKFQSHPKVSSVIQTNDYHEGRDKNLLYNEVRKRKPDWCIWVDIDEILEPHLTRKHFERLMNSSFINKYAFRRFHFIDTKYFAGSWFRLKYSAGHDRLMWRESAEGYFENYIIDSPNVKGIKGLKWNTSFRIKHLGYINKTIVDKKASLYRTIIPEKESTFQEMYLTNEKKIKWYDERNNVHVILLNSLLNCLQAYHLFHKAYWRIIGLLSYKNTQSTHTVTTIAEHQPVKKLYASKQSASGN